MRRLLRRVRVAFQRDGDDVGDRGERIAARHLGRNGYEIIERNHRIGRDEADIVAIDPADGALVIVEVKTQGQDQPPPESRIDRHKQYRLARLAARLLQSERFRDQRVRFDAIAVVIPPSGAPTVRHYVAAFESPL